MIKLREGLIPVILAGMQIAVADFSPVRAQTLGMVADDASDSVIVFNADADTVIASIPVAPGSVGDCSITPDQALGFVTGFNLQVTVVDLNNLTTLPAIPIANFGEDTALTSNGKCLVVCDGSAIQPVSSIDVDSLTQVDTLALPLDCNSVDVCSDGTVLATSFNTALIHRLSIDGSCMLSNSGDSISIGNFPNNVTCAPGSASLLAVTRAISNELRSFTTPPLSGPVSVESLSGASSSGLAAVFDSTGSVVYARSNSAVDAFSYNAATGALGAPLAGFPIAVDFRPTFFGMDQLGLHPNGSKLYVSNLGSLDVYDANTGAFLKSILDPDIISPTGICFASALRVKIDLQPGSNPNCGNREKSRGRVPVAIFGSDSLDVEEIDQSTIEFGGAPAVRCSIEDARMEGPAGVFTTDGIPDLVCHFKSQEVDWSPIGDDCGSIDLAGALNDGRPILGTDTACMAGGGPTCEAGDPLPLP